MNALLECPILKLAVDHDVNPRKEDCIIELTEKFLTENEDNLWLVLSGDWGGQIYLTIPIAMLPKDRKQAERAIRSLLREIDDAEWGSNEGDGRGAEVVYTKHPGRGVSGGMGGGRLLKGQVWFHSDLRGRWETRAAKCFK
ncbi:hypothetical protein HZB94_04225 [Candidatus Falkowbacteria bacterium]|nr:hypothetical protein [Candidatus Falkowbacteria bacterium]